MRHRLVDIHARKAKVEQEQLRIAARTCNLHQLLISARVFDLDIGIDLGEDRCNPFAKDGVIVGHQHPWAGRRVLALNSHSLVLLDCPDNAFSRRARP